MVYNKTLVSITRIPLLFHHSIELFAVRNVNEEFATVPRRQGLKRVPRCRRRLVLVEDPSETCLYERGHGRPSPGGLFAQSLYHRIIYVQSGLHMGNHIIGKALGQRDDPTGKLCQFGRFRVYQIMIGLRSRMRSVMAWTRASARSGEWWELSESGFAGCEDWQDGLVGGCCLNCDSCDLYDWCDCVAGPGELAPGVPVFFGWELGVAGV